MNFDDLYQFYKEGVNSTHDALSRLARRFEEGRNKTLIEAAACSAAVMGLNLESGFDPSTLSPELLESFKLAFLNMEIEDITNYSGDQLNGLLQPWKGKLFEVSVRDRLNEGEWVGDYHLEAGQFAELAESANQPGWDLQILNADGSVAELVQLKATNYIDYVESALNKYPDFNIISTSELSAHDGLIDGLTVSDISDSYLESQLSESLSEDGFGLLDLGLPLIPLTLNIFWVANGERTLDEAATSLATSAAAMAVGDYMGDIATDIIGDVVGDTILDGFGSLLLDGLFGFGAFTLLRLAFGGSRKSSNRSAQKAQLLAKEQSAIDSTCRRIYETFENATKGIKRMEHYYLPNLAN